MLKEIVKNYTKNEIPIWSDEIFKQLLAEWPNEEEITVYRGINFGTKKEYDDFIKVFNKQGGYLSSNCSGFAKNYNTALEFSTTTKTYFPTLEVMMASAKRRELAEQMNGYAGVVLTTVVPKHSVVDVNLSGEGVEDEVLFAPNTLIPCTLEKIKSLSELTSDKTFNINEYVKKVSMNTNAFKDNILNYIIVNKNNKLNDQSKSILINMVIDGYKENAPYVAERFKVLSSNDTFMALLEENKSYGETHKHISFMIPYFKELELNNIINEESLEKIKKIAREACFKAMEIHLEYRDTYKIDFSAFKDISHHFDKHTQEMYQKAIGYKKKETYDNINEGIRNIFKDTNLTSSEKSRLVQNEVNSLKQFLTSLVEEAPLTEIDIKTEKKERLKRREDILKSKP